MVREGKSESKFSHFFRYKEERKRIYLDVSPQFSCIASELVQALHVIYDGIFQALEVQKDILLSKPFLDLSQNDRIPTLRPLEFHAFGKLKKTSPRPAISVWRHRQSWGPEMVSGAGRLAVPPGLGRSYSTSRRVGEQVRELCGKKEGKCPNMSVCFYCFHLPPVIYKNKETYFLTCPRIFMGLVWYLGSGVVTSLNTINQSVFLMGSRFVSFT
jgi:hypothetical protein